MKPINYFTGKYYFLSNFYRCCNIKYKSEIYSSSEHLFQALKTKNKKEREIIRKAKSPGEAKRLGQQVSLRSDWKLVRVKKMYKVLKLKFSQNSELAKKLIETKDAFLIEGNNWHDNFWGICNCIRCQEKQTELANPNIIYEEGNQLGQLLMRLRKKLNKKLCKS